jgi:hypothetical protein
MKKHLLIALVFVLAIGLSGCKIFGKKPEAPPKEVLPKIETVKDASTYENKRVMVEGIYTQVDIRMKKENPPVQYTGQVALKLKDNSLVFIYPPTSPEAKRAKKEIKDMQGQEVRVVGMIYKSMPTSDVIKSRLPAAIIGSPYLTYIEKMELVNPLPPKKKGRK